MKKLIRFFIFLLGYTFLLQAYAEDIEVSATVENNIIQLNQYLIYEITVSMENSADISEPRIPDINGFQFLSRQQSSRFFTSFINGQSKTVRSQIFTYEFQAVKLGKFIIPPAEVYVGNTSYKTNQIEVTVQEETVAGKQQKTQRRTLFDEDDDLFSQFFRSGKKNTNPPSSQNLKDTFFIHVEVDKNSVYVGEQIIVSWYLYTKHNVTDIDTLKYPLLEGFWKEDIQTSTRLSFTQEIQNGMVYKKALLSKYALFPIKEGISYIDPYEVRCGIVADSFFGFGRFNFFKPQTYTKKSKAIVIQVKPLPIQGRPDDFSGAVGQYSLDIQEPEQTKLKLNEPFNYSLKFTGKGNAKRIQTPAFRLPDRLESYDTQITSEYFEDGSSYKTFDFLFIPRRSGLISIPQTTFSYFDPQKEMYVQEQIPSWQIDVLSGPVIAEKSHTFQKAKKTSALEDVLPHPKLTISSPLFSKKTKRILWTLVYTGLLFILIGKALIGFGVVRRKQSLQSQFEQRWKTIYNLESQGRFRDVGVAVLKLMNDELSEIATRKEVTASQLLENTPSRLRKKLKKPLIDLIARFEALSFAPQDAVERIDQKQIHKDLKELEYLFQDIFKGN